MRKLTKLYLFLGVVVGAGLTLPPANAQEYEPWTGAIVGANIHLGNNDTLKSIRRLINEGKTSDAVRESQKFINRLEANSRSGRTSSYEYDAYNALCIALTSNKQYDEAKSACNSAIELAPARWQAINSRGTLNYKTGKFTEALADYRNALEKAPDVERVRRIIKHNVEISLARVSEN